MQQPWWSCFKCQLSLVILFFLHYNWVTHYKSNSATIYSQKTVISEAFTPQKRPEFRILITAEYDQQYALIWTRLKSIFKLVGEFFMSALTRPTSRALCLISLRILLTTEPCPAKPWYCRWPPGGPWGRSQRWPRWRWRPWGRCARPCRPWVPGLQRSPACAWK